MMESGEVSAQFVADMCLAYMSEDDVADMMLSNDILEEDEEEEEDEPDVDEATEWADFGESYD
jgi:hypothetical protein